MSNLPSLTTRRESFADGLTIRVDEGGSGRPMLVLHGGGGPQTMLELSKVLAKRGHVLLPTHPGFSGEPRPEWFDSIDDLALAYLDLLERLNLRDVLVIGSSMGGWIASVMATRDTSHLLSGIALIDAGGIKVEGHPVADVSTLTPDELANISYHNPAAFRIDPATVSPEQAQARTANIRALYTYDQGQGLSDPKLLRQLKRVNIPVLVAWGESDRVIDPEYGRAYAQAFPNARFQLIPEAGHLPQFEQPQRLVNLLIEFATTTQGLQAPSYESR